MDARTFEQRLAGMHQHEQRLATTVGHAQAARRLAEKRADAAEGHVATLKGIVASQQRASVTEPLTYRRGGKHSFFYDVVRARRSIEGARERLERHQREMDAELPKRAEARARAAAAAYEAAFYSTPADRRAMDTALAAGFTPFERRAMSRIDGQGGYPRAAALPG